MGASLLTLFVATAHAPLNVLTGGILFPLGLQTILIAHIMFNISYVVVTVRARMQGFPRHLEEAAMDLGANEWTTFWKVTFPLIFPGIMAAALLCFSLSIDDFVITQFSAGTQNTFPLWVWASIKNNLPPQVQVLGTIVFVGAVGLVVVSTTIQRRSARRVARGDPVTTLSEPPMGAEGPAGAAGATGPAPEVRRDGLARPVGRAAGLEPDHEPDRRPRRGLVARHDRRRALPRLQLRASAWRTPAMLIRGSPPRSPSRRRS